MLFTALGRNVPKKQLWSSHFGREERSGHHRSWVFRSAVLERALGKLSDEAAHLAFRGDRRHRNPALEQVGFHPLRKKYHQAT